jgi:hypothetical protein
VKPSHRDAFSQPEFDALVIQFRETALGNLAHLAADMLEAAVQHVLGTSAVGWQINPVPGMPAYFDLIPPSEQHISVKGGLT